MSYFVREDNVAEPDEIFSIHIANTILNVNQGVPVTIVVLSVNVTIIDNDGECNIKLHASQVVCNSWRGRLVYRASFSSHGVHTLPAFARLSSRLMAVQLAI